MSIRGKFFTGVVALAGFTMTACSGAPTAPTAAGAAPSAADGNASASMPDGGMFAAAATSGADLQVSGSASTGSPNPGATFSYTFQVKNSGPVSATATTLTDALPAGTGLVGATANGASAACAAAGAVVSCSLGDLASGGQGTVVVTLTAPVPPV